MPKKFAKVNGRLVLERTRRTIPRETDLASEEARFDAISESLYGKTFSAPALSSPIIPDISTEEAVEDYHLYLEDEMLEEALKEYQEGIIEDE